LSAQYARRMDSSNIPDAPPTYRHEHHPPPHERKSSSFDRNHTQRSEQAPGVQPSFSTSTASSTTLSDESSVAHSRNHRIPPDMGSPVSRPGKFKWKASKPRDPSSAAVVDHKPTGRIEHTFQQLSVLRLTRCDHCGDKMWGSQLRCTGKYGFRISGKSKLTTMSTWRLQYLRTCTMYQPRSTCLLESSTVKSRTPSKPRSSP
jgi:hypothetical protein